jgi:hypothetical protein
MENSLYELPKHVVRYIEDELRMYNTLKTSIPVLEQDYLDVLNKSRQFSMVPGSSNNDDKLGNDAVKLVGLQNKSMDCIRRVERIEMGVRLCTEDEKKLITAKYFSGFDYRDEAIMQQLNFGYRNNYFAIKKSAVYKFAIVFGLI